jgi:hypothetical protein
MVMQGDGPVLTGPRRPGREVTGDADAFSIHVAHVRLTTAHRLQGKQEATRMTFMSEFQGGFPLHA